MHPCFQEGLNLLELRAKPLAHRLPEHRELAIPLFPTDVREAEKIEGLWFPFAALRLRLRSTAWIVGSSTRASPSRIWIGR